MSHMHKDEKEVLTRRDALKTIAAATGAITLTNLPAKWQTPLVEVGTLPAHAASSAFTVSGLSVQIPTANNCGGGQGSEETITFSYHDPSGNVTDATIIHDTFTFLPSGFSATDNIPITDPAIVWNGNAVSGTITLTFCVSFVGDTSIQEAISLTNAAGQTSNTQTASAAAPPGAAAQGNGSSSKSR